MSELVVALHGRHGAAFALDVAFAVPASGVTALTGASASGKTSVLRAVAGLDRHSGTVRFAGATWQDDRVFVPPHRRGVGYVPQGGGLLPHLTVAANLDYAARRGPAAGGPDRGEIVAATGIAALLDRRPAALSGGEAQRAAVARALVGRPRLLLLDEPLAALDAAGRAGLLEALADLFSVLSVPVVYVTHDAGEAARLATREVRLEAGCVA